MATGMTEQQAREMARLIGEQGKFTSIEVAQLGGEFANPNSPWEVYLWSVIAAAGNQNLTTVREYQPEMAGAITRKATGKATKADQSAFARIAAAREIDRE